MINKQLVEEFNLGGFDSPQLAVGWFNALLTRSRWQKIGGVETTLIPTRSSQKKGTQPDLLRPPLAT
jgi:hypothetical protein